MTERKLPDEFLEKLILKGMLTDPYYTASLISTFKPEYFDDSEISKSFNFIKDHFEQYNQLPPKDILINHFQDEEESDKISSIFKELDSVDYDISKNFEHLFNETNEYLKEKAFKDALLKGVELVEKKENPLQYKNIIEEALSKDLKIDLGVDYWGDLKERLRKICTEKEERVPSYFPLLDEFISGGFPPYTLNVFLSRIHGGKTNMMINMAARQVLQGYNPLIISLEMSESALAQRLDAIYSKLDINRIYLDKNLFSKMTNRLKEFKQNSNLGNLIIKEFATGKATVADFETYIRELKYRGIHPSPIYCDYLQIIGSAIKNGKKHTYYWRFQNSTQSCSLCYEKGRI